MVADRHHGDDLLPVQKQRQGTLGDHPGFHRLAVLVDSGDRSRQPRIIGVGPQQITFGRRIGRHQKSRMSAVRNAMCPAQPACGNPTN
jgi:hypothetical protein